LAEQTPDQLRQMNELLEIQRQKLEQITNLSAAEEARLDAIAKLQKQITDSQAEERTLRQESLDAMRDAALQAEKANDALDDEISKIENKYKRGQDISEQDKEKIKNLENQKVANDAIIAQIQVENELREDSVQVAEDILETTLGISKQQQGVVGLLQKSANAGKSFGESLADVGSDLAEGMSGVLTPVNMLASVASKIVESTVKMVFETDNALANFNQMTTAGGALNEVIFSASLDTRKFGVGMEDTVKAAEELYTSFTGFTELSDEAKKDTLTLAAGLQKAGVSASETGKIFDTALKSFGMNASEAQDLSKELLVTAEELRVPAGQLASDFNSAMSELAKYGPAGVDVFKELAAQAKDAGVEMSTLLGIAGQFDTIEGAVTATSKLNAILGTTMNSMELLNAQEDDRIVLLKKGMEASGQTFDALDRHEKQAIAASLSMSDLNEVSKLFNAQGSAFDSTADSMKNVTGATADLERTTKPAVSMQEQLGLMMEAMAVGVMPLIRLLRPLVQLLFGIVEVVGLILTPVGILLELFVDLATGFADFLGVSEGLGIVLTALAFGAIAYVGSAFIALSTPITISGAAAAASSFSFASMGTALMSVALPALAVVAALAILGLAIYALYEYGEEIIEFFMNVGSMIGDVFGSIIDGAMNLGSAMVDGIVSGLSDLGSAIAEPFVDAWDSVTGFFGFASPAQVATDLGYGLIDGLGGALSGLSDFMMAPFTLAWDAVSGFFSTETVAAITQPFVEAFDMVSDIVSSAIDGVLNIISGISDFVVELGSTIASFFGNLFAPILDFLSPIIDILRPFFNFFIEGMNFILTGLNSLSFTVPDWVPGIGGEEFGFNLPLIPLLEEGGVIDDDGVAYLHQGEKVLPTAEVSALDEATSAAMDFMASPFEMVGGLVGGAADAMFGTDEQLIAAIKENTAAIATLAGSGGGGEGGGKTIVLQMNEREFGRAVTKTLNDRNNLSLG
jgi:phage-related protein